MTQDYNGYSPEMSDEIQYAVKQIENEGYVSVENVSEEVEKELATMGYIRQPVDTELVIAPKPSRPEVLKSKEPTKAEEVANNILERQSEARDHLVDMLMKDPGALATFGDDWEVNMGQISFHTDPESMRTLDEYRIQVVQEVRFRARKPEEEIPVEALKQHGHIEQVFQNLEDARDMEDRLRRLLTQYGAVARDDFLTLNGESGTYEDAIWGWRDFSDLRIVKRGTTWVMKFPLETRLHTDQ